MKKIKKFGALVLSITMLMGLNLFPASVNAAVKNTIEKYIGSFQTFSDVTDFTVNKKKPDKLSSALKNKIIVTKTRTNTRGIAVVKNAFTKGNAELEYKTTYNYDILFKQAGTYTVKYKKTQRKYSYSFSSSSKRYIISVTDVVKGTTTAGGTSENELFDKKTDADGSPYFINGNGEIYASSTEAGGFTKASLNAENKLVYQAPEMVTEAYTDTFKVTDYNPYIKKITLGNARVEYSGSRSFEKGATTTSEYNLFLSGKKGKLSVVMGSGYSINDIVVVTYDKKGQIQLKQYKNNSVVTFGAYKLKYSKSLNEGLSDLPAKYTGTVKSLYKDTRVYIYYKDNVTGASTDIKKIKKNSDGTYDITYSTVNKKGEKPVTETLKNQPGPIETGHFDAFVFYKR